MNINSTEHSSPSTFGCCSAECIITTCDNTPVGGIAFVVASIAIRSFSRSMCAPLIGLGASIIVTTLVKNGVEWYDSRLLIDLTKGAHKFYKRFEHLQLIAVIFSFAVSFIYQPLGLIGGVLIGTVSALVMDTERSKLGQQANRRRIRTT